ncbi:MAG: efflux transporter outer membrane subunit [Acidobacteria bacterium]|nr:efflux transporter outer membrane subunit [Acidobacteriota bacterium]
MALALLLSGCVVGPKYKRPPLTDLGPNPALGPVGAAPSYGSQQLKPGGDIPGDWWTVFHSPALSGLVERSLKANPNLKAAQAALATARENALAQRGAYYPNVAAGFSAQRAKTAADLSPTTASGALNFSLFTPQVSVSFVPDVFGLNRRTVEALSAQAEEARFAMAATHITLSANVVTAAIGEAGLRAQIEATQELIRINTDELATVNKQYAEGYVSGLEVAAQEAQLAQTSAALPPLIKQLEQQRDLMRALAGGFPNDEIPQFEMAGLELPSEIPVSLPSQIVEQRPDVRQAEENLRAAGALVGVAVANRLPSFSITGDIGTMALAFSRIFADGNGFRDVAGGVTQPIFQAGTLRHRQRAAEAAMEQAKQQYRATILNAFQNVADTLNALQQDAEALKAAGAARDAANAALELAQRQFQSGYTSYVALLNAEQAYQQARINAVQAQAARYSDTAALFQALGGGWWNRADLPK